MPATGRTSQSFHLGLGAVAIAAFSALASSPGSAPGSSFAVSRAACRTPGSGCTRLSCISASRSMSCSTSMPSGRPPYSLLAGTPFFSVSPTLSPMISLRQMQGAVRDTPCFSAISAAGPVLASSSAMACTFFSMGTGSRFGFGPLYLRWPGASSSI
jgi:hypothetical protein